MHLLLPLLTSLSDVLLRELPRGLRRAAVKADADCHQHLYHQPGHFRYPSRVHVSRRSSLYTIIP